MSKPKVCIIGVYFGNLPNYFDLWLRSAEYNKTIDFLVFTNVQRDNLPENVKFVNTTLEDVKKRASDAIGIDVLLERPYKLCDLKVAYGLIFQEYIQEYDYWGHCDFDLLWGDLRGFFDTYHLENYDRFLPLGHLCLYRNTLENNKRFMLSGSEVGDYIKVFTSEESFAFDEENGIDKIFTKHGFPMFSKKLFVDIGTHRKRYYCNFNGKDYKHQIFIWRNGKTYRVYFENGKMNFEEAIYIHFQKRGNYSVFGDCLTSDTVYLTNKGFFVGDEEITLESIKQYNPYPGRLYEIFESTVFHIKYRIKVLKRRVKNFFK